MGLFSGITKAFKSVTGSTLGRTLLIAGATYLGGAAFGMWESPFDSINGLFSSDASSTSGLRAQSNVAGMLDSADSSPAGATLNSDRASSSLAAADTGTMTDVGGSPEGDALAAATNPSGIINQSIADTAAPRQGQDAVADLEGSSQAPLGTPASSAVDTAAKTPSTQLQKVLDFYKGDFAKAALTTQLGGAIAGAFKPTPQQIAQANANAQYDARRKFEQQRAQDRAQNYNVGNIHLPQPGAVAPGVPTPAGLINRNIG